MHLLDDVRHDLVYALRTLRREPALAAGVVLTFALAIGANAAMVALVSRLMLSAPPGVRDAGRVAHVTLVFKEPDGQRYPLTTTSYPVFRAMAEPGGPFSAAAAVYTTRLPVGRGADAQKCRPSRRPATTSPCWARSRRWVASSGPAMTRCRWEVPSWCSATPTGGASLRVRLRCSAAGS